MKKPDLRLLADMTIPELVDVHNALASRMLVRDDRALVRHWPGTREELVERIESMRPAGKRRVVVRRGPRRKMRHLGIGKFCLGLVCRVVGETDDGHPMGLSYRRMLAIVRNKFPESAVDEKHLRWYAAKARREKMDVPAWRGRSRWNAPAEEYRKTTKKEVQK